MLGADEDTRRVAWAQFDDVIRELTNELPAGFQPN